MPIEIKFQYLITVNKGHAQHLHDIVFIIFIFLLPYPSHSFLLDPYFNKLIRIMSTRCMMPAEYFCSGEIDKSQVSSIFLSLSVYLFVSFCPSLSLSLSNSAYLPLITLSISLSLPLSFLSLLISFVFFYCYKLTLFFTHYDK